MPESIEAQGLTVDEAIQVALNRLGVTRDRVEIQILHNARSGFLGVGARRAKVRATVRSDFMADGEEYDMGDGQSRGRRRRSRGGRGRRGRGGQSQSEGAQAGQSNTEQSGQSGRGGGQTGQGQQQGQRGDSGRGSRSGRGGRGDGRRGGQDRRRGRGGEAAAKPPSRPADSSSQPGAAVQVVAAPKHDPATLRERAESQMSMIITGMGIEASVVASMNGDGEILVSIEQAEAEGLLIGRRGQTLDALEHVINRMVTRGESSGELRVVIDIGGYRERRRTTLLELADRLTGRAQTERRALQVSPMSPHDRKIFEEAVESRDGMGTRVLGTGFYRRIEVAPVDLTAEEQRAGREAARSEDIDVAEDTEVEAAGLPETTPNDTAPPPAKRVMPRAAPKLVIPRPAAPKAGGSDDGEEGPQPVVEGQPHALNADRHAEADTEPTVDDEDDLDQNSVRAAVERYNKRLGVKVPPGEHD
ncbi:MAG: RNA-binding cell elongation regulator Jag/EloR [Deltaproteobacteria bacterium]